MATHALSRFGGWTELSAGDKLAIEQSIARFEAAWHQGERPSIEAFVEQSSLEGAVRFELIRELVAIDREFRESRQESLAETEYFRRFPELEAMSAEFSTIANSRSVGALLGISPAGSLAERETIELAATYTRPIAHARGGLGEILIAHDERLGRRVAVKRLQKQHLESEQAKRAFALEVELTSRLEHPGIVPVHGLGSTEDGQLCYVMRFVEGETLAAAIQACHAQSGGSISFRDDRFRSIWLTLIAVCNTVAYAHSRGVLHCDLKPENIMRGRFGETLVLDWGLAKLLPIPTAETARVATQDGVGRTNNKPLGGASYPGPSDVMASIRNELVLAPTVDGDTVGTPAYMSPEQATGERREIGPATDVFGIGAILFAILTGAAPYASDSPRNSLRKAAQRELIPPSAKNPAVPATLEAICRRAMAKSPHARYSSPLELARDLEHWLSDEPTSVHVESWWDRLRRSARRRRSLVAALCVLTLALPTLLVATALVVMRERGKSETARQTAAVREAATNEIADYLTATFQSADPAPYESTGFVGREGRLSDATMRRMLHRGEQLIHEHLAHQPERRAILLAAIGNSYLNLGDHDRAQSAIEESLSIRREKLGEDAAETLESMHLRSRLDHEQGHYREAIAGYRRVIKGREELEPPRPLLAAETKFQLAWALFYQPLGLDRPQDDGDTVRESVRLFQEVLETRRRLLPPNHRSLGNALAALAAAELCAPGNEIVAAFHIEQANRILSQSDDENEVGGLIVAYSRAEYLRRQKRYAECDDLYRRLLEHGRKTYGPKHPAIVLHLLNMAGMYRQMSDLPSADKALTEVRALLKDLPHLRSTPVVVDALCQYGEALREIEDARWRDVLSEAQTYAHERPKGNESSLERLDKFLGQFLGQRLDENQMP